MDDKKQLFDKCLAITGGYVAGGACRSMFDGTKMRDIDVFFETEKEYNEAIEKTAKHMKVSVDLLQPIAHTNAIAIKDFFPGVEVNLCGVNFCGPIKMFETFDFHCCKIAYHDGFTRKHKESVSCCIDKVLSCGYDLAFPFGALLRLQKYINYGYTVPVGTLYAIAQGIRDADENSVFYREQVLENKKTETPFDYPLPF